MADTVAMLRWSREAVSRAEHLVTGAWEGVAEARRDAERAEDVLASLRMAHAAAAARAPDDGVRRRKPN